MVVSSLWTAIAQRRRLFRGSSDVQTAQRQPIIGTPDEVPHPRTVTFIKESPADTLSHRALGLAEKPKEVIGCGRLDRIDADLLDLGELRGDMGDIGGLVFLTTIRFRREIGTVRFQKNAVEGDMANGLAQLLRSRLNVKIPRVRDKSPVQQPRSQARARAVAMDDSLIPAL